MTRPVRRTLVQILQNFRMTSIKINFSQISEYSTANSPDASYIIGGRYTKKLVAKFKNDEWRQLDDLIQGRYCHGSITIGTQTMVVGGVGT